MPAKKQTPQERLAELESQRAELDKQIEAVKKEIAPDQEAPRSSARRGSAR